MTEIRIEINLKVNGREIDLKNLIMKEPVYSDGGEYWCALCDRSPGNHSDDCLWYKIKKILIALIHDAKNEPDIIDRIEEFMLSE